MKSIGVLSILLVAASGLSFAGQRYQNSGGGKSSKAFQPQSNASASSYGSHYSVPKFGDRSASYSTSKYGSTAARGDHPASAARSDSGTPRGAVVPKYNPNFTGTLQTGKMSALAPVNPYLHMTSATAGSMTAPLYLKSAIPGVPNMIPSAPVDNLMRYYHPVGSGHVDDGMPKVRLKPWRASGKTFNKVGDNNMAWRRKVAANPDLALREQQGREMEAAGFK